MSRDRKSNWGVLVAAAAAVFAALVYWIFSASEAPTLPFAIGQFALLGSVAVAMLDSLAKCGRTR